MARSRSSSPQRERGKQAQAENFGGVHPQLMLGLRNVRQVLILMAEPLGEIFMSKILAALGLASALMFAPAIAFADDAAAPAADAKMAPKPMMHHHHMMKHHHMMAKHHHMMMKHHMMKHHAMHHMMKKPMAAPDAPKS